jgi:hypothetical protein
VYTDAVDPDPGVKRFSATIHPREDQQGHIITKLVDQNDNLMKIICEAPNYVRSNDTICTYNQIFNWIQRRTKTDIVIYVRVLD